MIVTCAASGKIDENVRVHFPRGYGFPDLFFSLSRLTKLSSALVAAEWSRGILLVNSGVMVA